ncbi:MAG TPA: NAD-dependent epimerase/dehydratase family protein [Ktedonobacterales bacterium]|nr:NAD-dependent epimerase/dehydratase family protein [Ktedonobacterales bacterium]
MKVLVAGGAGFIGSHLCARLVREGHTVVCLDNLLTGAERNIAPLLATEPTNGSARGFTFVRRDVTEPLDADGLARDLGGFAPEAIFQLASPASPVGYWNYPFETIRVNTIGTTNLLELASQCGARLLTASTSESYGDPLVHPQREDYYGNVNPIGVRACYDESKRLGETITMEYVRRKGVDARIVRIFNTYGPNSQLNDGRMIPNFITRALSHQPLSIHGAGDQTRSICYVDDLVDGLMRALFTPETTGEVFNLGNPEEHSIKEWALRIIALCGSPSELVYEPKREDDPERRRPDITKARTRLGWEPRITPDEGLTRTIAWFRDEMEREGLCLPARAG